MRPSVSKRSWKFYLGYSAFLLLLLLTAAEFSLRLLGHGPWKPVLQEFHVDPGGSLFIPDSLTGFRGRPGKFTCRIGDKLSFSVTHDANGFRPTTFQPDTFSKPEIWIFGCSFTHGYGVDDSLTWPWRVQEEMPEYRVRNFAMTAFSTYQSKLLLGELLEKPHGKIHSVVLAYGAFHNQRNTASRFWRKAVDGQGAANGITYPYILPEGKSAYSSRRGQLAYDPWPGQSYSALLHFLETQSNHREEQKLQSDDLSALLVNEMQNLSTISGAKFILATVQDDEPTRRMVSGLGNIPIIDISPDLNDPGLRILPEDGHPNGKGHAKMAEAFLKGFQR